MERPIRDRLIAGGTHLGILLGLPGLFVVGLTFALLKPRSEFLTGHLAQSFAFQLLAYVTHLALMAIFVAAGLDITTIGGEPWAPGGGAVLLMVTLQFCFLGAAVCGAIRGFIGEEFQYPLLNLDDFTRKK